MFSFSLVRGQLSARAVCVAVGEIRGAGLVLETWGWTEAICWVSRGVHREKKEEKEWGCFRSELLDILLCISAGQWD